MQVKDVLQKTTQFFRDKGIETARLDTELLIASALNWERMKIYLNYEYPMSEAELSTCRELVRRRAAGEPIAYILGKRDFYKHTFKVSPAVLIPRPETEQIVEETSLKTPARIVDLGTGSGCIGLSLLAELPEAKLVAVDLSSAALSIARENAESLGVVNRVQFIEADAAKLDSIEVEEFLGGPADAVVANPPYIAPDDPQVQTSVKRYEPESALFSADGGLQHIREWATKAADLLTEGGFVMFEMGFEQGRAAKEIFESTNRFTNVEIVKDLSGRDRFVRATRGPANS